MERKALVQECILNETILSETGMEQGIRAFLRLDFRRFSGTVLMSKVRVRIESRRLSPTASRQERLDNIDRMLKILKKACDDYGIPSAYKDHQYFIRKCDRRRWKRLAAKSARRDGNRDAQMGGW